MRGVEGRAEEPACPRVGIGSPLGHALFPFARRAPAKAGAQTRREWASLRPDQIPASGAPRSSACAGAGRYPKERVALRPVHSLAEISFNPRSEEHTSELQSLMRISYAVCCLQKK